MKHVPSLKITAVADTSAAGCSLVRQWLRDHNWMANREFMEDLQRTENAAQPLILVARDYKGVIGGLFAETRLAWLRIAIMAVRPDSRSRGVGTAILAEAERLAIARGCQHSYVDTMDYQAPRFYTSRGYRIAGEIPDWDSRGHRKLFLTKGLTDSAPENSPAVSLKHRMATADDCPRLAELNHQLIRDEGHRNRMTVSELEERMRNWIAHEYRAVIFEEGDEIVAYVLYREDGQEVYLRQLFVVPCHRGRGIGRRAVEILRSQLWPKSKRLTVAALIANKRAIHFWRSIGYTDYALSFEIQPQQLEE